MCVYGSTSVLCEKFNHNSTRKLKIGYWEYLGCTLYKRVFDLIPHSGLKKTTYNPYQTYTAVIVPLKELVLIFKQQSHSCQVVRLLRTEWCTYNHHHLQSTAGLLHKCLPLEVTWWPCSQHQVLDCHCVTSLIQLLHSSNHCVVCVYTRSMVSHPAAGIHIIDVSQHDSQ